MILILIVFIHFQSPSSVRKIENHIHARRSTHEKSPDSKDDSGDQLTDDGETDDGSDNDSPQQQDNKNHCIPENNKCDRTKHLSGSKNNLSTSCTDNSKDNEKISQQNKLIGLGIIAVIIAILSQVKLPLNNSETITISNLRERFPLQPRETLENIETIIDDVLKIEPIHPAVFLFIYKDDKTHDDFTNEVSKYASLKLNVNNPHIVLDENEYHSQNVKNDFGYLIYKYKPKLEISRVMIIKNLHNMSGKTAQALHSFCDEITPLVDRAVYFLTLKVHSFTGSDVHIAEQKLNEYWADLESDILAPLITRVTSTVIKIY